MLFNSLSLSLNFFIIILSQCSAVSNRGRESGNFGWSISSGTVYLMRCVCVCVVAERLKKRERSKKNKGESIYADQHFLSFTMFRSWILLQAFSIVFQRFPNPEKLKQPQPPSHSDASALTPLTLFFLCLFLLLYIVFVLYEKLGARLFLKF